MFKFAMSREEIISTVTNLRNGTMARINYVTELPMKAEFAKLGYKILKVTETTARFGIKYSNLSAVKEITIPASVTAFDHAMVYKCNNLKEIYYSGDNFIAFFVIQKNTAFHYIHYIIKARRK